MEIRAAMLQLYDRPRRGGRPDGLRSTARWPGIRQTLIRTTMHDIVEFLRRHAPFDDLSEKDLEDLAQSAEGEYLAAGTTIFRQQEGPMEHVRVVRRGAVELLDRGQVLDLLGEGELFGHPSMLSGLPTGFEARAAEGTTCYRIRAEVAHEPLSRPSGLRFVARSLLELWTERPAAVAEELGVDTA